MLDEIGVIARVDAVDEVHGAACHAAAVIERLSGAMQPGKSRQQRGVDIEDGARVPAEQRRGHDAHVAGKHDEFDVVGFEHGNDLLLVDLARQARVRQADRVDARGDGAVKGAHPGNVDDNNDDDKGAAAAGGVVEDGLQVAARSRREHRHTQGRFDTALSLQQRLVAHA